jgi:hypothetical protein
MPRCPPGFPNETLAGGFELSRHEADWLRERILATTDGSLLANLLREAKPVERSTPWDAVMAVELPGDLVDRLRDAERFSIAAQGARLLYDLMLAERYLDAGYTAVAVDLDQYRQRLYAWQAAERHPELFDNWEPTDLWAWVRRRNRNIKRLATDFFDQWFSVAAERGSHNLTADQELRQAIQLRERRLKGANARLSNDKLLATWGGGASGQTTFRWPQVSRLVNDVVAGLQRSDVDARP